MHDSRRLDARRHIGLRDQQLFQHPAGMYTFDLSGGYDTGDTPQNDYLKHIGIS